MTAVKAKFYVTNVEAPEGATAAKVSLSAVCRGVENSLWAQATPCGTITMHVKNDAAFEQFEKYAEYEVLFRKVAKPTPGDGHDPIPAANMHGQVVCEFCGMALGWTDEAVEKQPTLAPYNTDEKRADLRRTHDEAFGAKVVSDS